MPANSWYTIRANGKHYTESKNIMAKFTFKKHIMSGKLAISEGKFTYADIKMGGKLVGFISKALYGKWSITFKVRNGESWKNTTISAKFDEYEEAKEFVIKHTDAILAKFELALYSL